MKIIELETAPLATLREIAKEHGIPNAARLKKENLLIRIRQVEAEREGLEVRGGILEIMNEGIGFLRTNYQLGPDDVYVSQAQLRRYDLRSGDLVIGHVRPPRRLFAIAGSVALAVALMVAVAAYPPAARFRTPLRLAEGGEHQRAVSGGGAQSTHFREPDADLSG